jgi:hypothetical protein
MCICNLDLVCKNFQLWASYVWIRFLRRFTSSVCVECFSMLYLWLKFTNYFFSWFTGMRVATTHLQRGLPLLRQVYSTENPGPNCFEVWSRWDRCGKFCWLLQTGWLNAPRHTTFGMLTENWDDTIILTAASVVCTFFNLWIFLRSYTFAMLTMIVVYYSRKNCWSERNWNLWRLISQQRKWAGARFVDYFIRSVYISILLGPWVWQWFFSDTYSSCYC